MRLTKEERETLTTWAKEPAAINRDVRDLVLKALLVIDETQHSLAQANEWLITGNVGDGVFRALDGCTRMYDREVEAHNTVRDHRALLLGVLLKWVEVEKQNDEQRSVNTAEARLAVHQQMKAAVEKVVDEITKEPPR